LHQQNEVVSKYRVPAFISQYTDHTTANVKANFFKHPMQKPVQLIAPTTTPILNDLIENPLDVLIDRAFQLYIQVFIGKN